MYLQTIPNGDMFSFVIIIFDCGFLFSGDSFPWDSRVPWAVEVSPPTRYLQGPTGFKSFSLAFMLISQLGSLYQVSSRNLEPKPVKMV